MTNSPIKRQVHPLEHSFDGHGGHVSGCLGCEVERLQRIEGQARRVVKWGWGPDATPGCKIDHMALKELLGYYKSDLKKRNPQQSRNAALTARFKGA